MSNRFAHAVALTLALAAGPGFSADDDLARELPRIPPKSGDEALRSFKMHAGFRLEPVATEPLVTDPVSVCYDADGRLYVVEMRGYPYPENTPSGNVTRLVDEDGDGRFDRATKFVDGLSWPTGVVPYDGGVFIAVAPDIIYAKDTDGDGVADVKKVIFTGFGTQNVQALVNGLLWGPDGWIYGVAGGNGGEIRNPGVPGFKPVSVRGRDFRFRPDGSVFQAISGGGQFGHSFDDWGHRFTCNNSNHIRQVVLPSELLERNPALVAGAVIDDIAVEGPAGPVFRISSAEPWRVVRTRQRAADPVMAKRLPPTELVATGFFTSATGVTIYRGTAYPAEFRGNAFIGDVGGNLVHRKTLDGNGAEFRATRADQGVEFIASTDNWFRPVNFANTPDGSLLMVDMYRETIEHPFSIPEPIKKHLDLTSGKDLGRLYHLLPAAGLKHRNVSLGSATSPALVTSLADPDAWWRETAQRLLIERHDPAAVAFLKELARTRPTPLARLHALWTLDALGEVADDDLLPAFKDAEPGVREQAARLAGGRLRNGSLLVEPLAALARDADPMVRFQTAFALGGLKDPRTLDALAEIARKDANDRWTRVAVESALAGRSADLIERLSVQDPGFFRSKAGRIWLEDLTVLVGTENDPAQVRSVLARFSGAETPAAFTRAVVLGLGRGLQRSGGSLRGLLAGPDGAALAPVFARAAETAAGDGDLDARIEAVRLLSLGPVEMAVDTLAPLLDARQPSALQLAAVQTLAGVNDPRVGTVLTGRWKTLSPGLRREAVEALFARADRLDALLTALESRAVSPTDIDPARAKTLLAHPDRTLRGRAAKVFGGLSTTSRSAVIERFKLAPTIAGDRDKGRAVFKKACATCHRAEGQGNDVGPNLATVTGRSPEDLLVHILDPNREVAPNYVSYNVATTDGLVVTGMIAEESANAVTLKRAEGATDVVPRARIESIASSGLSLMPEGLEQGLEPKDFADLLAFVRGILAGGQTAVP